MLSEEKIIDAIKGVIDPEVGFDVYSLGLIYKIEIHNDKAIVDMTLSTKGCPLHELMQQWVRDAVLKVNGINDCELNLVWEPAWNITMASNEVKEALGAKDA
jgi:metal-sulfur cluster biosynthetic enzyme